VEFHRATDQAKILGSPFRDAQSVCAPAPGTDDSVSTIESVSEPFARIRSLRPDEGGPPNHTVEFEGFVASKFRGLLPDSVILVRDGCVEMHGLLPSEETTF